MKKKDLKLKQPKSSKAIKPKNVKTSAKTSVKKKVKSKKSPAVKVKIDIKTSVKKEKPKKPHYVDPIVFSDLIVSSYVDGVLTEALAECILKIATRLSYAPNFINYSYRDEMIGDAIEKMLKAVKNKKFDPNIGNAFSYFTRIAFNAFCNRIKKEKKEKEFIMALQENVYNDMMGSGMIKHGQEQDEDQSFDYE